MGITLGTQPAPANPITEDAKGVMSGILKGTTDIDAEKIKDEWEEIKDNSDTTGRRVLDSTKMLNDETIGKTNKKLDDVNKAMDKHIIGGKSIIARSRNSVLQFPIYVTQSIRVNEAQIIAKLFERVYTSFVQTALAQNPILDEEDVNDLVFLKQFHTNLKESADLELFNEYYEPIDEVDSIMKEAAYNVIHVSPTMSVEFKFAPVKNMDLFRENSRLLNEPLLGLKYLNETNVNVDNKEETTKRTDKSVSTEEVKLSEKDIEEIALDRAQLSDKEKEYYGKTKKQIADDYDAHHKDADPSNREKDIEDLMKFKNSAEEKVREAVNDFKHDVKDGKISGYKYNGSNYIMAKSRATNSTSTSTKSVSIAKNPVDSPKLLRDADIKKINGMLPYTIETTFRVRNKKDGVAYDVHFIIGVKSVMHLINVQDLQDDLQELVTGTVKGLQKVRYKSGEIKWMDYVFNFKGLKKDAAKRVDYNKRWLNTLKRMADYDKLKGTMFKGVNDKAFHGENPIPNGTLILSQSDVNTLIANTGIDLSSISNARRLAKSLFLIGVVIVDPSAGSMKVFFPDSDTDWDVQSLAAIDAELAKTDNSQIMKELNRMINSR